ncbi:MAG: hypothetical protein L3K03_01965 [Thermoplasmata archaeon]|nr:hypothetical protein [Thermoplasmata archaeon]
MTLSPRSPGSPGRPGPAGDPRIASLALVLAALSVVAGYTVASVLPSVSVTQTANLDTGGDIQVVHYPVPTLEASTNPVGACTTGVLTLALSTSATPPVQNMVLSSTGGTCALGNYAEVYNFSFSVAVTGTAVTQTNAITMSSQLPAAASPTSTSESCKLTAAATTGTYTGDLDVYIDYGSATPPAAGVAVLDIVVS